MAENYYLNHTATQIDAILTKVDGIAAGANVNVQVDWNQTTTTADDYIKNKPTIPDAQIQSDWEQTNTESKDFIKNKPTIPDAQIQSDWNQTNTESKDFIKNKPTIPEAQVNSDWSAASGVAQILNKPTLGTAAAKDYTTAVLSLSNDLVTSSAVSTAISTKADLVDGKVPSAQLPSYVDDSIEGYYYEGVFYEDSSHTTAITGESGKIYIDLTANKSYRWTGSLYTRIDECPAFGETQGTIYEGNKGKANADAIGTLSSLTTTDKSSLVAAVNEVKSAIPTVDQSYSASSTNAQSGVAIEGKKPGLKTTGTEYTIDGQTVTADTGAEAFNDLTNNKASGQYSHAEGRYTTASGSYSHAEGGFTIASGDYSHAEGGSSPSIPGVTIASGDSSHAEGGITTASGDYSHAEGRRTTASGNYSHAEGNSTTASGSVSHAEGSGTKASSDNQHVQGKFNVEDSNDTYAFIIGNGTADSARHNAFAVDWNGLIYVNGAATGVDVAALAATIGDINTILEEVL